MAAVKKVYDFPFTKVQEQVRQILARSPGHEASVADLISTSGLPKHQLEQVLPAVVEDCRGQMKVTEKGDILYYFPKGLASQSRGLKVWARKALDLVARGGKFLFKVWIMGMLVGYFALFILLVILMIVASFAMKTASRNSDSDSDSGPSFLSGYFMMRIIDLLITFWIWREPRDPRSKRTNTRAFYKSVFAFVFGEEKVEEVWQQREKLAVLQLIRNRKGLITQEELMALTGKDREQASAYLSRLMLEYDGEPQVSDEGVLYYSFPEVLRTTREQGLSQELPRRPEIPFNANSKKANGWIGFFNAFNLAFGSYFAFFALSFPLITTQRILRDLADGFGFFFVFVEGYLLRGILDFGAEAARSTTLIGLGVVPLVFSAFFFGIPVLRRLRDQAKNKEIQKANLRKGLMEKILSDPMNVRLNPQEEKILPAVVGSSDVQVVSSGPGFSYQFKDIARLNREMANVRSQQNSQDFRPGKVIFDSGE